MFFNNININNNILHICNILLFIFMLLKNININNNILYIYNKLLFFC